MAKVKVIEVGKSFLGRLEGGFYDHELMQGDCIKGINYPASFQIGQDLQAVDIRSARRRKFLALLSEVANIGP